MAREVKAYGCQHKCGQKVVLSKKSMIDHESRCFYDPKKKACVTCVYFEREKDDNGLKGVYRDSWVNFVCHAKNEQMDKLQNNCAEHKPK